MSVTIGDVFSFFSKNQVWLSAFSSLHVVQAATSLPFNIVFSAIPADGDILEIEWWNGKQTLTFKNVVDNTGNQILITGATVPLFVKSLENTIPWNVEIRTDFKVTAAASTLALYPFEQNQNYLFALGSATTAPVTLDPVQPVPNIFNNDIQVMVVPLLESGFLQVPQQFLSPIAGQVEFCIGDMVDPQLGHYLPQTNLPANEHNVVPNIQVRAEVYAAEYNKLSGEYFRAVRSEPFTIIKGAMYEQYADLIRAAGNGIILFSHYTSKRVTALQHDFIYYMVTDATAGPADVFTAYRTMTFKYTNGLVFSDDSAEFQIELDRVLECYGGVPDNGFALTINTVGAGGIRVYRYDIDLKVKKNGVEIYSKPLRSYFIEEPDKNDYLLIYQSSFGVPEIMRLTGKNETSLKSDKVEFVRGSRNYSQTYRQRDFYDATSNLNFELATGLLPAAVIEQLSAELALSAAVYLMVSLTEYYPILIPGDKYIVNQGEQGLLSLSITAMTPTKEYGYGPKTPQ